MDNLKVLFLVLNKTHVLEQLLLALSEAGIRGATVLNSSGMAHTVANREESPIIGSLRAFFNSSQEENNTVFMVLRESEIEKVKRIIYKVVGDLNKPDTGVLFCLPVDFIEGI